MNHEETPIDSPRPTAESLLRAFKEAVDEFQAEAFRGPKAGNRFDHEDGFNWFEISGGLINRTSAGDFCQALADATNCRIILSKTASTYLEGAIDADDRHPTPDGRFPSYAELGRADELSEYGEIFDPSGPLTFNPKPKI